MHYLRQEFKKRKYRTFGQLRTATVLFRSVLDRYLPFRDDTDIPQRSRAAKKEKQTRGSSQAIEKRAPESAARRQVRPVAEGARARPSQKKKRRKMRGHRWLWPRLLAARASMAFAAAGRAARCAGDSCGAAMPANPRRPGLKSQEK